MKVLATAHACDRFKQRFRLRFHKDIFLSRESITFMIKKKFAESVSCDFALKQRIGFYNKLCCDYGIKVHYNMVGDMIFAYHNTDVGIVIRTVMTYDMVKRKLYLG